MSQRPGAIETRHPGILIANVPRPRTSVERTFVVLSDIHYPSRPDDAADAETRRAFETAIDDIERLGPSAVVLLGDVAHNGRPGALRRVARRLDSLDPPTYGVPGNHDLVTDDPERGVSPREFADHFAPDTYPYAVQTEGFSLTGGSVTTERVDPELPRLFARMLAAPGAAALAIHWPLERTVARLQATGIPKKHLATPVGDDGIARALAESDRHPIVLNGHLHLPFVTDVETHTEITAPPLCTYPCGYLVVRVGAAGTTVEFVPAVEDATRRIQRRRRLRRSDIERRLVELTDAQLAAPPTPDDLDPDSGRD